MMLKFSQQFFKAALNWCIVGLTAVLRLLQRKTPLFFNLQFLLLLSETGISPESCLAICHSKAICL